LQAVDFHLDVPKEIVIVTPRSRAEARPFLERLAARSPQSRLGRSLRRGDGSSASAGADRRRQASAGRKPTAYVCERFACQLPTADPATFKRQIERVERLGP
jgi:uncharacterized protein YyaL (SSP411 family)